MERILTLTPGSRLPQLDNVIQYSQIPCTTKNRIKSSESLKLYKYAGILSQL